MITERSDKLDPKTMYSLTLIIKFTNSIGFREFDGIAFSLVGWLAGSSAASTRPPEPKRKAAADNIAVGRIEARDDRARSTANPQAAPSVAAVTYRGVSGDRIAASPKIRQMLDEQDRNAVVIPPSPAVASAGYRATADDGIAASPRLRQQLNERSRQEFQVAPVK